MLVRFLRATVAGWKYARDKTYAITLTDAPRIEPVHQRRLLESVLQLVDDAAKIGLLDLSAYPHTSQR